jgi:hypothetical protein
MLPRIAWREAGPKKEKPGAKAGPLEKLARRDGNPFTTEHQPCSGF